MIKLIAVAALCITTLSSAYAQPISQLPPATLPLIGSEILPMTQNNTSVKVTVDNLRTSGALEMLVNAANAKLPDARTNLGLGTISTLNSPLPLANGGTAATSAADARTNLGLGTISTLNSPLPLANGGTAATSAATARGNLSAMARDANDATLPTARSNLGVTRSVITDYGAKCDGIQKGSGSIANGSSQFSSSAASFTSADIGKYIAILGAGAAGAPLSGTITSLVNSTTVGISAAAGTTVTTAQWVYGTDDTAAFASAISSTQVQAASVSTPTQPLTALPLLTFTGICLSGPQTLAGQLEIAGSQQVTSIFMLKAGVSTPAIKVQTAGADFGASGLPPGRIVLRSFRVASAAFKTDTANAATTHGISVEGGTWRPVVELDAVTVYGMPGDGLNCTTGQAAVHSRNGHYYNNGRYGVSFTSCNDPELSGDLIGVNVSNGIQWSGVSNGYLSRVNVYSNGEHGMDIFGAAKNTVIVQGSFDRNQKDGIRFHAYTGASTHLIGVNTELNNQSGGSFSDIHFDGGSSGGAYVTSPNMPTSYAAGTYHFQFDGGSTGKIYLTAGNGYIAGGNTGAQYTNSASQIVYATLPGGGDITSAGINLVSGGLGVGKTATAGTIALKTGTQFSGISLENESNIVAKLYGLSATNDNGVMELSAGGVSRVKISAGSGTNSYFNAGNKVGFGTTSPDNTLTFASSAALGWETGGTSDISLSRVSAGLLGVGTGLPGEVDGNLQVGGVGIGAAPISAGVVRLKSGTQFNGYSLENDTNVVGKLYGLSAANDNGVLDLYSGGAVKTKISGASGASSYFNAGSNTGFGTASPAATVHISGTGLIGGASSFTASSGELGFTKITASGTAPGAGVCKEEWVAGTGAGTCKKIAYCGTSTTPTTIIDNVGGGC